MAKKYEFRPDPRGFDFAGKLMLTRLQRQTILKWLLHSLLCIGGLILQDALFSRFRVLGGYVELAPALIVLICVMEGCDTGAVFALLGAMIYVFSGTGQDRYCIFYLTVAAILAAAFRQGYLRRGPSSELICVAGAMLCYELAVFATGAFLGLTQLSRVGIFFMTAVVSTLAAGAFYRVVQAVGTLGGNLWKE